ncbi:solute carrier family 23 protein [Rarobacter faecitabidus]|uniref:NCS2 family nucleobase:cation symporter-2 n=1 Tax=Rarobacter faecitabidus TaxID=13243 RepID=A0A542Z8K3_RARFA|nr:solute carrier family 23 protein [Rarobacter faecitabidus]TQL56669.1 NCS2 family nucleobase:cation symporter-2 [Rarobacter faecitabidus]
MKLPSALSWTKHGDGKTIAPGAVVAPHERLSWPRTIGIGTQHVLAMAGATLLVPAITGFPPSTTLLFSGIGTFLFLLLTRGRVPSYLGSSFAFIAPILATKQDYGMAGALGGIVIAGFALFLVGLIVQAAGTRWIEVLMPPAVTGTIVALIGLNLAPVAGDNFKAGAVEATVTLAVIILTAVLFRGILGRLSVMLGVVVGYIVGALQGHINYGLLGEGKTFDDFAWIGLPSFHAPAFHVTTVGLFLPVVLVLIAENVGHVKTVAQMTGKSLDAYTGRALMADGLATVVAGSGGGSATTTYGENIGVMGATRVYSTAAYWIAGATAVLLAFSPKVGAVIQAIPTGVLGGAGVVLYGMIGIMGARIWVDNRVNFSSSPNLMSAGVGIVIAIAGITWSIGNIEFGAIALGTIATLVVFHGMHTIGRWRRTI